MSAVGERRRRCNTRAVVLIAPSWGELWPGQRKPGGLCLVMRWDGKDGCFAFVNGDVDPWVIKTRGWASRSS